MKLSCPWRIYQLLVLKYFLAYLGSSVKTTTDTQLTLFLLQVILGDPGADSGGEGKSKRAGKYGAKKSEERREEPLGTMSCQTRSKRSPPFCLLIGAIKLWCFSAQSEGRTAATVLNWSGKTLSPGTLLAVLLRAIFSRPFRLPSPPLSAPGSPRMTSG